MGKETVFVTDERVAVSEALCSNSGRKIQWISEDGAVRIPDGKKKVFRYPSVFTVAGKKYIQWKQLCAKEEKDSCICRDIYGREVYHFFERFPCFDSYDYLHENRHHRWFFLKENGKLIRVYLADQQGKISVTEDTAVLENKFIEPLQELGWIAKE